MQVPRRGKDEAATAMGAAGGHWTAASMGYFCCTASRPSDTVHPGVAGLSATGLAYLAKFGGRPVVRGGHVRHKVVSEAALSLRKCLLREVATSGRK